MSWSALIELGVRKVAPPPAGPSANPLVSLLRRVLCGHSESPTSHVPYLGSFAAGHEQNLSGQPYPEPRAAIKERRAWERVLGDVLSC